MAVDGTAESGTYVGADEADVDGAADTAEPEDEGVWDDIEDTANSMFYHQHFLPRPPSVDPQGNTVITVINVSGIHFLPIVWCSCPDGPSHDRQLLSLDLFPSSFKDIKTVFTFKVLDDFRLENLECKTSAYQYYQKI